MITKQKMHDYRQTQYWKNKIKHAPLNICQITSCLNPTWSSLYCRPHRFGYIPKRHRIGRQTKEQVTVRFAPLNICDYQDCTKMTRRKARCTYHCGIDEKRLYYQNKQNLVHERNMQIKNLSLQELWLNIAKPIYDKVILD